MPIIQYKSPNLAYTLIYVSYAKMPGVITLPGHFKMPVALLLQVLNILNIFTLICTMFDNIHA